MSENPTQQETTPEDYQEGDELFPDVDGIVVDDSVEVDINVTFEDEQNDPKWLDENNDR